MEVIRRMNNRIFILVITLAIFGACNKKPSEPARLQVISMIPSVEQATVEITPINTSSEKIQMNLGYASPSGYRDFEPGKYDIIYRVDGTTLLKHKIVLGKKSYQTLLAAGMLPDSLRTNPTTHMFTIKKIFAGSESHDANGYMPQFIVLRDLYRGKKKEGMIRLVNASPFAKNVILKKGKKKLKKLAYPKFGEPMPVNSGSDTFNFFLGSVLLKAKTLNIENGYVHTIITGNSTSSDTSLTVVSYKTEAEVIRKK